jgi:glycosyltransferase involved in cell wall biosynthesis
LRLGIDLTACWRPRVGMATVALELAQAMVDESDQEHQLVLFASRERPPGFEAGSSQFLLSPYRHELLNKLRWLPKVTDKSGLGAVLYPYWPPPPGHGSRGQRTIAFIHDLAYRLRPKEVPWQQRLYMGALVPPALRHSAAVLVPSEATCQAVLDCYALPRLADRLHVLPAASNLEKTMPGPLPPGLGPGFILAVGTVEPRKNYPRLLAAYRQLGQRRPVPPLVVVGRAGWAYGRALDDLKSTPGVRYLGHVDDPTLLGLYQQAALLAFPSLYEGFGLPLLEAMQQGLPVLAGNAGSLPELAGDAALLIDPTDVDAIAAGLERLLEDKDFAARLAAAGRARASKFGWHKAARYVLDLVDEVAS